MNDVIRADDADAGRLSQVIADAFIDLPPSRWLISDRAARRDIFPGYFRMFVEHALASGTVHTTADRSAVALWQFVDDGHEDRQSAGIGAGLLRSYHQMIDEQDGAPAYLEASSDRVRGLYLRHGYALLPDGPCYLPDGGPPMWAMWRGMRRGLDRAGPRGKTTDQ